VDYAYAKNRFSVTALLPLFELTKNNTTNICNSRYSMHDSVVSAKAQTDGVSMETEDDAGSFCSGNWQTAVGFPSIR